jgi:hypothetical protein
LNPIKNNPDSSIQMNVNSLMTALKANNVHNSMFGTLMNFVHDDYGLSEERKAVLTELRQMFLESIMVSKASSDVDFGRYPTALTDNQGTEDWKRHRRLRITASEA